MRFSSFAEILGHYARATPDGPALRYEKNGILHTMTYARLRAEVDDARAALRETGADGKCTGFFLHRPQAETLIRFFAAVEAGRQAVLLDESAPVPVLRGLLPYTDIDALVGDPALVAGLETDLCVPKVADGAGRILFFTSGTTERSKAVVLTEGSLCASAYNGASLLPLAPEDTLLCVLPPDHVFGFVCGILWGLSCGACVALGRGPRHYCDDFTYFRPTAAPVVPALLDVLLRRESMNPELRLILVGAGECPPRLLDAAKARGLRVSFGYGLTETSSGVALSLGDDPYAMTVCPEHAVRIAPDGELLISAPGCMMQGYYKRGADTESVLRRGSLRSGDLGHFDGDGLLHVTGRKKEMLVLADGTKLFLPEYEAAIAAVLGTEELAVTLRDGNPALVLRGDGAEQDAVLEKLAPLMAERPQSQRLWETRLIGGPLPRTATGKLKRWEIRQMVEKLK